MQPKSNPKYETMNSGNTKAHTVAVSLAANPIVEKCLTKMANDVTAQVRDKLIDIIIAVLARECEDFDGETVRRLILAELESAPVAFELEKRATVPKTTKTKVVDLDADGNPVKKVRIPKEPKEKAPKAAKAPKAVLTEEERESLKAAKKAVKVVKFKRCCITRHIANAKAQHHNCVGVWSLACHLSHSPTFNGSHKHVAGHRRACRPQQNQRNNNGPTPARA